MQSYNVDVYAFAHHTATDHAGYDPLGLAMVRRIAGEPVDCAGLGARIRAAASGAGVE